MSGVTKTVKKIAVSALIFATLSLNGCGEEISPVTDNGTYATQQRMSAIEYSVFINKQVTVVAGHIMSRIVAIENAETVLSGTDEIKMAEESLEQIDDVLNSIRTAYPAVGEEDKRQAAILAISAARQNIAGYISELEQGHDVSPYKQILQSSYNAVTQCGDIYA